MKPETIKVKPLYDIQTLDFARTLCRGLVDQLNQIGDYPAADEVQKLVDIFTEELNYTSDMYAGAECAREGKLN